MADQRGNVLYAPGFNKTAEFLPKEIMGSMAGLVQKGVTMEPGNGDVEAGTVLGKVTATGRYAPYATAATNGTQTAACILRLGVDTGAAADAATAPVRLGSVVLSGVLKEDQLVGLDAGAKTALGGRSDSVHGYFIF